MPAQSDVRLVDLVASLALSSDLATGQPLEHSLRRTLIAVWLGSESGMEADDLRDTFYVALLGSVGCVLDGAALACYLDDEISFRGDMFALEMTSPAVAARYFTRRVGRGKPALQRISSLVGMSRQAGAICREVAMGVGGMLNLGPAVGEALGQCDEHWNGKASVLGLVGEQISVPARLFRLAQDIDVFSRSDGIDAAVTVVRARSGTYYDPHLSSVFMNQARDLARVLDVASTWDAILAAEPLPVRVLAPNEFDTVAGQIANVIDMRSAFTVGHSPAVAGLAEAAGQRLGLHSDESHTLRSAGLLHDLGRSGVPVTIWDKPGPLTQDERKRLERHPALTELVLARSSSLGPLGTLAGLHHERLDGSGYRGVTGPSIPLLARVLATADAYQSKLEPRAYRPPLTPSDAAASVRAQVAVGRLDGDVAAALIEVAGHVAQPEATAPSAGLTAREVEVLRLLVTGLSNREVAHALFLSPKTVGRHVERIYEKANVTTRVGVTLFAIENGLVAKPARPDPR